MTRNSRYKDAKPFIAGDGEQSVFRGFRPRAIGPAEGVVEHVVQAGDRLDALALHYYNDDRLWWRIVDANPEVLYGGDLVQRRDHPAGDPEPVLRSMVGEVIRIPRGRE